MWLRGKTLAGRMWVGPFLSLASTEQTQGPQVLAPATSDLHVPPQERQHPRHPGTFASATPLPGAGISDKLEDPGFNSPYHASGAIVLLTSP